MDLRVFPQKMEQIASNEQSNDIQPLDHHLLLNAPNEVPQVPVTKLTFQSELNLRILIPKPHLRYSKHPCLGQETSRYIFFLKKRFMCEDGAVLSNASPIESSMVLPKITCCPTSALVIVTKTSTHACLTKRYAAYTSCQHGHVVATRN